MYSSEPFPHFVEDYLAYLYETHPTQAAFDGVHAHDDLLEDLSRSGIDTHTRDLAAFGRRLDSIDPAGLPDDERIDRAIVEANIRARLFELEEVRTWERDPQFYADLLSSSLAAQVLFTYASEEERARRIHSKLRQLPRLLESARENVREPPGLFVKVAVETLRGVRTFVTNDLPRAFLTLDDVRLLSDLADASTEAGQAIDAYVTHLEAEIAPRTKGSFRLGQTRFEQKLRLEEGLNIGGDRLLAIALRELHETQEQFRKVATRLNGGDPVEAWRRAKQDHPKPGELIDTARTQVAELAEFLRRQRLVTVPEGESVVVAATPQFYRWTFASMWTPGPFETRPGRAFYYLTDVDPQWSDERKEEHLREFNHGALWSISMHEVYPGHFLHFQHLRQVASKVRRSIMFAPSSFVEGWAHYCEQMMVEAGFGRRDDLIRLGQLAEALIRLVRCIVGIRLHMEDLSVEQGVRFFRDEAFMEEASARREAERGTFDPTYVVYSAGKLMLLKLRADCEGREGDAYTLKGFHDRLLRNGSAPFWAQRRLMLGEETGALLE